MLQKVNAERVCPTQRQWSMTSTEIETRIGEICADKLKLDLELRQLEVIQAKRRRDVLRVACY